MKKRRMTVVEQLKATPDMKVPFNLARLFPCEKASQLSWSFANEEVSLCDGYHPGDYGSLEEWRALVSYLAEQFGGSVTWGGR